MSSQSNDTKTEAMTDATERLDVLGDECARTILVATSDGPRTAKELTERTDSSSATVYRRINDLLDSGLIAECVRFEDDGTHSTAYESTVSRLDIRIDAQGIDVLLCEPNVDS